MVWKDRDTITERQEKRLSTCSSRTTHLALAKPSSLQPAMRRCTALLLLTVDDEGVIVWCATSPADIFVAPAVLRPASAAAGSAPHWLLPARSVGPGGAMPCPQKRVNSLLWWFEGMGQAARLQQQHSIYYLHRRVVCEGQQWGPASRSGRCTLPQQRPAPPISGAECQQGRAEFEFALLSRSKGTLQVRYVREQGSFCKEHIGKVCRRRPHPIRRACSSRASVHCSVRPALLDRRQALNTDSERSRRALAKGARKCGL